MVFILIEKYNSSSSEIYGGFDQRNTQIIQRTNRKMNFFKGIGKAFNDTAKWTQNAAKDTANWTKKAAEDTGKWTKKAVEDTGKWTENAAKDTKDWTQNAAKDTAEWTGKKVQEGVNKVNGKITEYSKDPSKIGSDLVYVVEETGNKVIDCVEAPEKSINLSNQIKSIINTHKAQVESLEAIKGYLKQDLDMSKVNQKMKTVSSQISKAFDLLLEENYKIIHGIEGNQFNKQDIQFKKLPVFEQMEQMGEMLQLAQMLGFMGLPAKQIGQMLRVMSDFFNTIGNMFRVKDLEEKKNELDQYFKTGGKFQVSQKNMNDLGLKAVKVLPIFANAACNMMIMLRTIITLIESKNPQHSVDIGKGIKMLDQLLFSKQKQTELMQEFKQLSDNLNDGKISLSDKSQKTKEILKKVIYKMEIKKAIKSFESILDEFGKDKPLSIIIDTETNTIHKLKLIREAFKKDFGSHQRKIQRIKNKKDQGETEEQLAQLEEDILNQLTVEVSKIVPKEQQERIIAEVVSSFTTTFKGSDQLFGHSLSKLAESTQYWDYVDSKVNGFIIPKPFPKEQLEQWQSIKDVLMNNYRESHPDNLKNNFLHLYMNLTCKKKHIHDKIVTELQANYAVTVKTNNMIPDIHEMSLEKVLETKNKI